MEVKNLVNDIKTNLSQRSCSQKDEVKVMQAMLNDKEYVIDVYGNTGKIGEYSPAADARAMASSIISSTTKISKDEAAKLADNHTFSKAEASSMINIGKEFVNTYLDTGRKLSLGGREKSSVALLGVEKSVGETGYPKKVGEENGKGVYEIAKKTVPAHKSVKVFASCPTWVE